MDQLEHQLKKSTTLRESLPRNIDRMLYLFQQRKEYILDTLDPNIISEYFSADTECRRHMGNMDPESNFSCDNCEAIGRLTNLSKGVPKTINIETGDYEGGVLDIIETNQVLHNCKEDTDSMEYHRKLDMIEGLAECGLGLGKRAKRYISSDTWVNETLINWQIERIFDHKSIPHVIPVINSFVCDNKGYTVKLNQVEPLMNVESISEKEAYSILLQISSIFMTLKPYRFVHGSATIDKLGIVRKPCSYMNGDLVVSGPFTIYIKGFHMSSININDTRLIPSTRGRGVNLKMSVDNFKPIINKQSLGNYDIETGRQERGPLIYNTRGMETILMTSMRYSGYPIFGGSFDIYSMIVSLLSWHPFRCTVRSSEKLTAIIVNMFVYNKLPVINHENMTCSLKVATSLSDVWLYCDAVERLILLLKTYKI